MCSAYTIFFCVFYNTVNYNERAKDQDGSSYLYISTDIYLRKSQTYMFLRKDISVETLFINSSF